MHGFRYFERKFFLVFWLLVLFLICGCSSNGELPIEKIKNQLKNEPTYSIVLENMKEEGNFFKTYYHQYRVVKPDDGYTTDYLKVPEKYYQQNAPFMGMSLFAKKDGEYLTNVSPPGYHFVGDPKYGQWRTDSGGNSFWEFYGKYRLLTDFFGGWYRPVYMPDYNGYQKFKSRNVPYYGLKNEYGSKGDVVKKVKPNFYQRHMSKQSVKKTSFTDKVSKRIGRTRTSMRSRSGGWGK